jgi:NADPH:quinone reductase-like Zn-dependent oxidoreductase
MKILPNPFGTIRIPELDFAGVVASIRSDSTSPNARNQLTPGTRVFGVTYGTPLQLLQGKVSGTLAEYLVTHDDAVVVTPGGVSSEVAAGLGAVGCTAIRFLEYSKVGARDSILINGEFLLQYMIAGTALGFTSSFYNDSLSNSFLVPSP